MGAFFNYRSDKEVTNLKKIFMATFICYENLNLTHDNKVAYCITC